jgi:ABC-type polysaccharide transport system permease subunit
MFAAQGMMREKGGTFVSKKRQLKHGPHTWRLLYDTILFAILMAVGLFLPAVGYTYNDATYDLPGYRFLTGGLICGKTVAVAVSPWLWVVAVAAVAILVLSVVYWKGNRKLVAALIAALALAAMVAAVVFSMTVESTLSAAGAKRVGVQYSYLLMVAGAGLSLLTALRVFHQEKLLPDSYDILGYALMLAAFLSCPFGVYTYKKVQHPYTGLDMLGHKEIAKETVSSISVLPYLILGCVLIIVVMALLSNRAKRATAGVMLLASAGIIVCMVVITVSVKGMLSDAKSPAASSFTFVPMLLAIVIFCRGLYILHQTKTLTALDFMMVPGLIYLLINNYMPMIGISLAFKKIDYSVGIWNSPWVGLDNFKYLFGTKTAWIITRNTLLYNLAFIAVGIFTGMVVGICLFAVTKKAVQTFYQTSILLPQLISMIVVAYIVYAFLSNESGFINKTVLGDANAINFYGTKSVWPFLLLFINNWKQIGYNSIIFLSSIVGIDRGLYEAAMVDGCSPWKQITKITIPQLKPTIITLTLLQVGKVFYSDFGLFYQVTMDSGALYNVTNTIDTYVYRSLMVLNNLSSASAASAFQSVCGFILVFTVNMIVRKLDRDNALF